MKKILVKIICWFSGHDWTCNATKGIPPTKEQLTLEGFKDYAKMYCDRCGVASKLNQRLK